jgi:hypothetical protein
MFVMLIASAMWAYPGGTVWDPAAQGHDFWLNYLCDLERTVALDGRPNLLASVLARLAMGVLGLGSVAFWWLLSRAFERRAWLTRAVRRLGAAAAAGVVCVALFPSDRFATLHPFLLLVAGAAGIAASGLALAGLLGSRHGPSRVWIAGACVTASSTGDLAMYLAQLRGDSPGSPAIAVLERVTLVLVLLWMAMVGLGRRPS